MPELLRESRPKARKDHHCSCCTGLIPAGTTYGRETLIYDGRIYDWLTCDGCEGLTYIVYEWAYCPDEGVGPEEYTEWAEENRDDPEYGKAARAYLARAGIEAA